MASSSGADASSSSSFVASSFSSLSSSESQYSSTYGLGGNYTVANAGTAAANGTYAPFSTSDGVTSYKKTTGDVYMYRDNNGGDKYWIIGTVHGQALGGANTLYDHHASGATPPLGQWATTSGFGDVPDPTIAEA